MVSEFAQATFEARQLWRVDGILVSQQNKMIDKCMTWKAKCPIFKAIVAGFRGKVV